MMNEIYAPNKCPTVKICSGLGHNYIQSGVLRCGSCSTTFYNALSCSPRRVAVYTLETCQLISSRFVCFHELHTHHEFAKLPLSSALDLEETPSPYQCNGAQDCEGHQLFVTRLPSHRSLDTLNAGVSEYDAEGDASTLFVPLLAQGIIIRPVLLRGTRALFVAPVPKFCCYF